MSVYHQSAAPELAFDFTANFTRIYARFKEGFDRVRRRSIGTRGRKVLRRRYGRSNVYNSIEETFRLAWARGITRGGPRVYFTSRPRCAFLELNYPSTLRLYETPQREQRGES